MVRLIISAVALAGILVLARPAAADPQTAPAADHGHPAPAAVQEAAPQAPAWPSSPGIIAPAGAGQSKEVPVGFGWG